ncbi:hypothetical protein ACT3R9_03595 [Psychrobacter sp. AOP42-A1-21]|jgi:hypothetical protein|uniref:hypothetical protein n=1 Tax=Psychrobacter TaxID=497 RepID=UPI001787F321|nr:hypothetical protein [Psychrobacter sp. FME13]MBE0441177.1 hypothetical protein [Psychrobacter sp. FME13]
MTQLREQTLNLVKCSQNVKFSGNRIVADFILKSNENIILIESLEAGHFENIVRFKTNDHYEEVGQKINYTLTVLNTGDQYASYESYIEHALEDESYDTSPDEIIVYEDKYDFKNSGDNTLLPTLELIFKFINCLKEQYYFKDKQIVIFTQTHCEIPTMPSGTKRYLDTAKLYLSSVNTSKPSSSESGNLCTIIEKFTSWLNADINNADDEVKKSLLVHETERNTIVASIVIDSLVGVEKEDRVFSLLQNLESTYQSVLSKYALYLDDFKFSKFNDKITEHSEKFLEKANDIITNLQTQILAIPVTIALISMAKFSAKINSLVIGSICVYSVMVLYATLQQGYNLWHLRCQINGFVAENKIPDALLNKWKSEITPVKVKIITHAGYLFLVFALIIFVIVNCLDYFYNWEMITPLEQLLSSTNPPSKQNNQ